MIPFLKRSKGPTCVKTGTTLYVPKDINVRLCKIFLSEDKTRKGQGTGTLAAWATDGHELLDPQVRFELWVLRIRLILKPGY